MSSFVYEILHDPVTKKLILPKPSLQLVSESLVDVAGAKIYPTAQQECGLEFEYSITGLEAVSAASLANSPTTDFPELDILSSDSQLSGMTEAEAYKRQYVFQLQAKLTSFGDAPTYTCPTSLDFFMRDSCIGMHFANPQIKAEVTDRQLNR